MFLSCFDVAIDCQANLTVPNATVRPTLTSAPLSALLAVECRAGHYINTTDRSTGRVVLNCEGDKQWRIADYQIGAVARLTEQQVMDGCQGESRGTWSFQFPTGLFIDFLILISA